MTRFAALFLLVCLTSSTPRAQASGAVTLENLGQGRAQATSEPRLFGQRVLVDAEEDTDGVDYNGDGDMQDQVPQLHFLDTGEVRNLGLAGSSFADTDSGAWIALLACEQANALTDFNGDGDTDDSVLFVHDVENDLTTNVGIATGIGLAFPTHGKVLFTAREQAALSEDLNGDGDSLDSVLHLYDPETRLLTNSGLASNLNLQLFHPLWTARAVEWVLFGVRESDQGGADLDGDGLATSNRVIHAISLVDGTLLNLRIDALDIYGGTDAIDVLIHDRKTGRLHTFDGLTALCRTLNVAKVLDTTHVAFPAGRAFVYLDPESNADLNGDGDVDPMDWIVRVVSSTGGRIDVLPFAATDLAVDLPYAAFLVDEAQQNADLNADGDFVDSVLHVLDLADLSVLNTGLVTGKLGKDPYTERCFAHQKYLRDGLVTTTVLESDLQVDQNGDGDTLDEIAVAVDCATGQMWTSGIAIETSSYDFDHDAGIVWFSMNEQAQAQDGNADGDLLDEIPMGWHACGGAPASSGIAGSLAFSSLPLGHATDSRDLVEVRESSATGDLNGDGDVLDEVLHVVELVGESALPAGLGAGTPGIHGVIPRLSATGCARAGSSLRYFLEDGLGGVPALLIFGTTPQSIPILGGTLYLFPFDLLVSATLRGELSTPAAGYVLFDTGTLDAGLAGLTFYTQAGVLDPGAIGSIALSNAVVVTIKP